MSAIPSNISPYNPPPATKTSTFRIVLITVAAWLVLMVAGVLLIPLLALSAVVVTVITILAVALLPFLIGAALIYVGKQLTLSGVRAGSVLNTTGWIIVTVTICLMATAMLGYLVFNAF